MTSELIFVCAHVSHSVTQMLFETDAHVLICLIRNVSFANVAITLAVQFSCDVRMSVTALLRCCLKLMHMFILARSFEGLICLICNVSFANVAITLGSAMCTSHTTMCGHRSNVLNG